MKISISSAVLILAIGGMFGWKERHRLEIVCESHSKLVAEAASFGRILDNTASDGKVCLTKRERIHQKKNAEMTTAEISHFLGEMETWAKAECPLDETQIPQMRDYWNRVMSLDAQQLKALIAAVLLNSNPDEVGTSSPISTLISRLAQEDPQAALRFLTESAKNFEGTGIREQTIGACLTQWASDNPLAAVAWFKNNKELLSLGPDHGLEQSLICGAASHDPKLALKLIEKLGLKDGIRGFGPSIVINSATTPAQRTATFAAFRDYMTTLTDGSEKDLVMGNVAFCLANRAAEEGFEAGSKWIENAGFTEKQLSHIVMNNFAQTATNEDSGKWIEWIGKNMKDQKSSSGIDNNLTTWTKNDYLAAGKWLAATPNGPTKNTSIRIYAETISEYHPEVAVQWAMTLPPGDYRESTLFLIYQKWPATDPAGKVAFSKLHGFN